MLSPPLPKGPFDFPCSWGGLGEATKIPRLKNLPLPLLDHVVTRVLCQKSDRCKDGGDKDIPRLSCHLEAPTA
jgi:hypothetical protein